MTKPGDSIRDKRTARNADLAAERAKVVTDDHGGEAGETVDVSPRDGAEWLRLQRGNPEANPFLSERFLVDAWSLASDLDVPLLPVLPRPEKVRELREACRLPLEAVAERACVTPEMWSAYEHGSTAVLEHINTNQLLQFVSVMSICVDAGGPPVPVEPEPLPERPPMTVVGTELLADLAREAGDRFELAHAVMDDRLSARIARGEVPSPTLTDWPSEKEAMRLISAFPGLANRRRSVPWTPGSLLADFMEQDDFTDQPFIPRDELGVGKAGLLRLLGAMCAIVTADPERVAIIEAEQAAADQRRQAQDEAAVKARAAVAQAALILATVEATEANAAEAS